MNEYNDTIKELLAKKADISARLALIAYDGTPEIKTTSGSARYLYVRKRVASRLTSEYVGPYSDELYQTLLRSQRESRALHRQLREIEKALAKEDYTDTGLSPQVMLNLDFARANMKSAIYDQAVLEGVATTFPQTEEIIERGTVNGMKADDVQKILNLKHAWEFILDPDVLMFRSDYSILCHIAGFVNEGFYRDGGRIRGIPVMIGGTSYVPPMPIETVVKERIGDIISSGKSPIDTASDLCLYCMKTQIFNDGNKRAAVIFANHFLISSGDGLLVIPETEVPEFKRLLVRYYEDKDEGEISDFLKNKCWARL